MKSVILLCALLQSTPAGAISKRGLRGPAGFAKKVAAAVDSKQHFSDAKDNLLELRPTRSRSTARRAIYRAGAKRVLLSALEMLRSSTLQWHEAELAFETLRDLSPALTPKDREGLKAADALKVARRKLLADAASSSALGKILYVRSAARLAIGTDQEPTLIAKARRIHLDAIADVRLGVDHLGDFSHAKFSDFDQMARHVYGLRRFEADLNLPRDPGVDAEVREHLFALGEKTIAPILRDARLRHPMIDLKKALEEIDAVDVIYRKYYPAAGSPAASFESDIRVLRERVATLNPTPP